ncbi:MAG: alpha/beta hydrolase [Gammaproteobacteria bacterium]
MSVELDTLEIETGDVPEASIIWLHGLGADGNDFAPIVPQLDLPCDVRFVFPHAPIRAVTINNGARMRAWYDILSLERTDIEDEAGIRDSASAVAALIDAERARGLASDRIFIAGFSQGGAIALHQGLRHPERLAGILALSTYLPLGWTLDEEKHSVNEGIPIFMAHGALDNVLPESLGQVTREALVQRGYEVEWQSYPMPHSVCPEEIADVSRWLKERLS